MADVGGDHQPRHGTVTQVTKVRVADVEAHYERARSHGARILEPPAERQYGERDGPVRSGWGPHGGREILHRRRLVLRGRLAVGMVVGCVIKPFFDALAGFHEAHPGVQITVREGSSDQLVDQVRRGGVDLALVGYARRPPANLSSLVIVSEGLVAVVPPGHELARRPSTTLAQVVQHPTVCMPPGTGIRAAFDQACAGRSLRPTIAIQAAAADSVADLAARGLGIGILSTSLAASHETQLQALSIRDATIPALLLILWRRPGASIAARELAERCRAAFRLDAPA